MSVEAGVRVTVVCDGVHLPSKMEAMNDGMKNRASEKGKLISS